MVRPSIFSTYRGYLKYGFPQTLKGFPLLFTQHTVEQKLENCDNDILKNNKVKNTISGMAGGMTQAIFITPLQRGRSIIVTATPNTINPLLTVGQTIKTEGIMTLMKGWQPTVAKGTMDWGLRFYFKSIAEDYFKNKKVSRTDLDTIITLTNSEKILCGLFAGLTSAISIPFDVMIAMTQQHKEKKQSSLSIIKESYKTHGMKSFTRGLTIRIANSSWHTMFVIGVGDIIFTSLKKKD